jgi:twitching motility protein PilT
MGSMSAGQGDDEAGTSRRHARLESLFEHLVELRGSDLHLQAGSCPRIRVDGLLRKVPGEMAMTAGDTDRIARALLSDEDISVLESGREVDLAYYDPQLGRFRVHVFLQSGSIAMSFRHVPSKVPTFADLNLPPTVRQLADEQRGLVLVTGPTGSGKTTTLASMLAHINNTRECHIVTIEDPIEFVHRGELAEVSQREIGVDTKDFPAAMRAAMRQDPDVILVGEMRDAETVSAAIHAAETGHLVLSTLHTTDVTETVSRIVDFFPPHHHHQVRVSLAASLRGVIGQRLVPLAHLPGRVPALEILVTNGRVEQCILDPERHRDLGEIIAAGDFYGMTTFDQSLARLCSQQLIEIDVALRSSSNPHDLKLLLHRLEAESEEESGRLAAVSGRRSGL